MNKSITQTNAKIKREHIRGQQQLETTALEVGRNVREAIRKNGGTMPEDIPPEVHIKKIKSELTKTSKALDLFTNQPKYAIQN